MARETANLKLFLYDSIEDKNVKVKDVIDNVLGYTNSNTTKIDAKFKSVDDNTQVLHDHILDSKGNVIFYSKTEMDTLLTKHTKDTLLAAYPVGSLYMSTEATSPASFLGGTWEQIKDRFILAAGDTYVAGDTGGEAKHILTVDEMPQHGHNIAKGNKNSNGTGAKFEVYDAYQSESSITAGYYWYATTKSAGGSHSHNNMPPYLTAYIWKRIA